MPYFIFKSAKVKIYFAMTNTNKKFVETSRKEINDTKYKVVNVWYDDCYQRSIPYITVITRVKFADVHWDYITYSHEAEANLNKNYKILENKVDEIFDKYRNEKSAGRLVGLLADFKNLEIDKARLAAVELYDAIYELSLKSD